MLKPTHRASIAQIDDQDSPVLLISFDEHWNVTELSGQWLPYTGCDVAELRRKNLMDLLNPEGDGTEVDRIVGELSATGRITDFRLLIPTADGSVEELFLNANPLFTEDSVFQGVKGLCTLGPGMCPSESQLIEKIESLTHEFIELRDHKERVEDQGREYIEVAETLSIARDEAEQAALRAEESEKRFRTIVSSVADGILVIDRQGFIQIFNHAAESIFGHSVFDSIGKNIDLIVDDDGSLKTYLLAENPSAARFHKEVRGIRRDGSTFPMELTATGTNFGSSSIFIVICRDISDRKQAEQELQHLAKFDPLTGLANRSLFHDKLEDALKVADRNATGVAVLFLDLDHFKDVNDTLGHPAGDHLLEVVAERLNNCVRDTDTVARLGGDEFAIIATQLVDRTTIHRLAVRIVSSIAEPVEIESYKVHTGASIGVTLFPDDERDPDRLLKNADLALYRAKSNGRNTFEFFHPEMNENIHRRIRLENELRDAIGAQKLFLHYQPQVEVSTGQIVGVETLIRWRGLDGNLVPPDIFIPIAESCGLMLPITKGVLEEATRQAKEWRDQGIFMGRVAINLSPSDLKNADLFDLVMETLERNELDASSLELEITEGMMMECVDVVFENLRLFRDSGIRLAIDDFGTGYASLSYLRRFSVDRLKIDRTFITDLTTNQDDVAITEAIINMGHSLDLRVVAEGVETVEQFEMLKARGCDEVQGYFLGRPMAHDAFEKFIREFNVSGGMAPVHSDKPATA